MFFFPKNLLSLVCLQSSSRKEGTHNRGRKAETEIEGKDVFFQRVLLVHPSSSFVSLTYGVSVCVCVCVSCFKFNYLFLNSLLPSLVFFFSCHSFSLCLHHSSYPFFFLFVFVFHDHIPCQHRFLRSLLLLLFWVFPFRSTLLSVFFLLSAACFLYILKRNKKKSEPPPLQNGQRCIQ